MFSRNITDKTGLEPSQLFSVVQFLMYDKAFAGFVTLDQTMHMLYNRYGKDRLETEMKVRRAKRAAARAGAAPRAQPEPRAACAAAATRRRPPALTRPARSAHPIPNRARAQALFGNSIVENGNAKLNFLEYLSRVKMRANALAAAAAEEQKEKYSGAPGVKKK